MASVTSKSSAGWGRIKFFYKYSANMALEATSETTGYEASYVLNRLENNHWQSGSTSTQYLTDIGDAGSYTAVDYLILYGTNLKTAGAIVSLQYSSDNFSSDINDVFTPEVPADDGIFFKEFAQVTALYWRLEITTPSVAPKITILHWGEVVELDFCTSNFDPNAFINNSVVNRSNNGYQLGIYETFTERQQQFTWDNIELDIYDKIIAWAIAIGKQNFFIGWDTENHDTEIYMMYWADGEFKAPFSENGLYRTLTLNFTGRKL